MRVLRAEFMISAAAPRGFPPAEAFTPDRWLEQGDRVTVGEQELQVIHCPGHTPGHQSVLVESAGESALYLGDLVPTSAHLPLPWIMGYDVEPLVTLETKRQVLERATRERTLLLFGHDPNIAWGYLAPQEKKPTLVAQRPDYIGTGVAHVRPKTNSCYRQLRQDARRAVSRRPRSRAERQKLKCRVSVGTK